MARALRGDDIEANVDKWAAEMEARAVVAMREVMAALEGWAKSEHGHPGASVRGPQSGTGPQRRVKNGEPHNEPHSPPFWDETGQTTQSIRGEVVEIAREIVRGVLTAGMEWDVFLELSRNGKWAFLWPTLMNHKDEINAMIAKRMLEG